MRANPQAGQNEPSPPRPTTFRRPTAGFTLVELLTVIIIIGLLAAILLPTVTSARKSAYLAMTLAQQKNLNDGAENYKMDHGQFYPGQDDDSHYGTYTGSQILAACLFDYDIMNANPEPTGKYAAFKEENLVDLEDKDNSVRNRTLSDMFPKGKELAFCYFAWRDDTFHYTDNEAFSGISGSTAASFTLFTTDIRFNDSFNKGRFLLIAPGGDRTYFTADDIKNW